MEKVLYLTHDEQKSLIEAARSRGLYQHAFISTVLSLGLRVSEAVGLERGDFDYKRSKLIVGVLKKKGKKKTEDGGAVPQRQSCELSPNVNEILYRHIQNSPSSNWIFYYPKIPDRQATRHNLTDIYWSLGREIGLPHEKVRRIHVLRHTRAMREVEYLKNLSQETGQSLSASEVLLRLKTLLRHTDETVCLKYIQMSEAAKKLSEQAALKLDSMF